MSNHMIPVGPEFSAGEILVREESNKSHTKSKWRVTVGGTVLLLSRDELTDLEDAIGDALDYQEAMAS